MVLGSIDGNEVVYNPEKDTVFCKNTTVSAEAIIAAYESAVDRIPIQKDLVLRKNPHEFTLGCFTLTPQLSKLLIKQIKNARRNRTGKASE